MSLYNMIHGTTPATFFVLPMLGKHPDEYPRFRDCFIADEEHPEYNDHIHVYTRVGGNNRGEGYGEEALYDMPGFVTTFDDSFDNTFATYVFKIPEKWAADFQLFKENRIKEFSQEYKDEIIRVFPKLKDTLMKLWGG
jgi:hypothetical protein